LEGLRIGVVSVDEGFDLTLQLSDPGVNAAFDLAGAHWQNRLRSSVRLWLFSSVEVSI
jgi:hypothetical protein